MQIGLSCTCLSKHGFLSVLPHGKHLRLEARHHWHAIQGPSGRPPGSNKYNYINISNHHFLFHCDCNVKNMISNFVLFVEVFFDTCFRSLGFPFTSIPIISNLIFNFLFYSLGESHLWNQILISIFFFYKRSLIASCDAAKTENLRTHSPESQSSLSHAVG